MNSDTWIRRAICPSEAEGHIPHSREFSAAQLDVSGYGAARLETNPRGTQMLTLHVWKLVGSVIPDAQNDTAIWTGSP